MNKYHIKFSDSLINLGLEPDHVFNNYVCVGGDGYTYVLKGTPNTRHTREFKMVFGHLNFPPHKNECLCGHKIVENCYINDGFTTDLSKTLIIGNCCYKSFIKNKLRKCYNCGEIHDNSNGLCFNCNELKKANKSLYKKRVLSLFDSYNEALDIEFKKYKLMTDKQYNILNGHRFIQFINTEELFKNYLKELNDIYEIYLSNQHLIQTMRYRLIRTNIKNKDIEINNSLIIFNKILKINDGKISGLTIYHTDKYSVLNIFRKGALVKTINLLTCKETSKSRNELNYNMYRSLTL